MKMQLDPELHRILLKRITKAVIKARYYPATATDEAAIAEEVLRPFAPRPELHDSHVRVFACLIALHSIGDY